LLLLILGEPGSDGSKGRARERPALLVAKVLEFWNELRKPGDL
jgi:hypothetical protein